MHICTSKLHVCFFIHTYIHNITLHYLTLHYSRLHYIHYIHAYITYTTQTCSDVLSTCDVECNSRAKTPTKQIDTMR